MDSLLGLETEIEDRKTMLDRTEQEFKSWKSRTIEETKLTENEKQKEKSILKKEIEYLKESKERKQESYNLKIKELDKALGALAEISKASVEQASKNV